MDIAQLRSFLTVVETGSISTAAHALGVKQPALSKSIRRLEKQLGVELFERQPRGVTPTNYGETLLHFALAMDSNYRSALRRIEALSNARSGELVIGAGGTWLEEQLPLAIARLVTERRSPLLEMLPPGARDGPRFQWRRPLQRLGLLLRQPSVLILDDAEPAKP